MSSSYDKVAEGGVAPRPLGYESNWGTTHPITTASGKYTNRTCVVQLMGLEVYPTTLLTQYLRKDLNLSRSAYETDVPPWNPNISLTQLLHVESLALHSQLVSVR